MALYTEFDTLSCTFHGLIGRDFLQQYLAMNKGSAQRNIDNGNIDLGIPRKTYINRSSY